MSVPENPTIQRHLVSCPVSYVLCVQHTSSPDPVLRPVTVCLVSAPEPIVCSVCVRVGPSSMLGGVCNND